jgi:hypothetical protein
MPSPFTTQVGASTPFDGTEETDGTPVSPVFASDNVRDGIIEAREEALGLPRFTLNLSYNGVIANNTFIGYLNTIPGNTTPVTFPFDCVVEEFTFSNSRTGADYTLEFRKNTTGGAAFFDISKVNTQFFSDITISETFSAGDSIYIKYKDDGRNAKDVVIVLYFRRTL